MEVADRLPFEITARIAPDGPTIDQDHHLSPLFQVMSTKGAGTARPFVRVNPADLTLYQALVDALARTLEVSLAERDRVFAYRQTLLGSDDPFDTTPRWTDFTASVRNVLEKQEFQYVLTADIASYFVYIEVAQLERKLLAAGAPPAVVNDLRLLLSTWQAMGLQGIPQGLPCSSPLGNFYLKDLDDLLIAEGYEFRRYMDDLWVFAPTFSEARRVQDLVERHLYELRLSLGGEKSRVLRNETALEEAQAAKERIERRAATMFAEVLENAGDGYEDEVILVDPTEIDAAAVQEEYQEVIQAVRAGDYPKALRSRFIEIYRQMEALREAGPVADIPEVLQRFPDLTGPAMRYAAQSSRVDSERAVAAFLDVLDSRRFHRDHEFLLIFRAALWLPNGCSEELSKVLGSYSKASPSWFLRARALLAWGAHSADDDFGCVDEFWEEAHPGSQAYALVAIQGKELDARNERYEKWSGEGRFLRTLADAIRVQPFQWRTL
jgi:hypothetical protein